MTQSTQDARIVQELVFKRDQSASGLTGIELSYEIDDPVTEFGLTLPSTVRVDHTRGFESSDGTWEWDGATARPRLTGSYQIPDHRTSGAIYVDAGDWAILKAPSQAASWRYRGVDEIEFIESIRVDGPGTTSPDDAVIYLGEYDSVESREAGQQLTLVIPAAANMAVQPTDLFDAVGDIAEYLSVGGYRGEVLMIAAPSANAEWGPLGTQTGETGFWALDRVRLDEPNCTWLHEYVHTRQAPTFGPSMQWFVEGTACYHATHCSIARGDLPFNTGREFFATSTHRRAVLTNPSAWPSPQTKYTKGRRVVAALDCEIRRHTDAEQDLRSVWGRLNAAYETVEYANFVDALRSTIQDAAPIVEWCDKFIDGAESPAVPDNPQAYGLQARSPESAEVGTPEPTSGQTPSPNGPDADPIARPEPKKEPDDADSESDSETGSDEPSSGVTSDAEDDDSGEVRTCPICDASVDSNAGYCTDCGTAVGRTCHVCGSSAPGQRYCPECGTKLVNSCGICGTETQTPAAFCTRCGNEL